MRSFYVFTDTVIPQRTHTSFYHQDHFSLRLSDTLNLIPSTITMCITIVLFHSTTTLVGTYHQLSVPPIIPYFDSTSPLVLLLTVHSFRSYTTQQLLSSVVINIIQHHQYPRQTPYIDSNSLLLFLSYL